MLGPPACDMCGAPLLGDDADITEAACDECAKVPRPWAAGRAAIRYADKGRQLVMALKHGDRPDLAKTLATWMHRAGRDILTPETVLVPVPIHWTRLVTRQYNQSAELAVALSRQAGCRVTVDALQRVRRTPVQGTLAPAARFENVRHAVRANARRADIFQNGDVCLIDDVMTSGATLGICAHACAAAGARRITVLVLARAARAL